MEAKKIIYLIDEDKVDCFIVNAILEHTLPESILHQFYSVEDALTKLISLKQASKEYPMLILLDLNMPGKDGWDFLEEYTALESYPFNSCKVIILTSSINPKDKIRAGKYDCVVDFFIKPLTHDQVNDKIKEILLTA